MRTLRVFRCFFGNIGRWDYTPIPSRIGLREAWRMARLVNGYKVGDYKPTKRYLRRLREESDV